MNDYCIMTDSCCDLDPEMAQEMDLTVLPLSLHMGTETYENWLDGREISFTDFYRRVRAGEMPTTAAVSAGRFEDAMRQVLEDGRDILCICFSSGLSATYQSAVMAAEHLRPSFPERRIEVVDSLCASGGQGLLLWLCVQEKRAGRSLPEVQEYAEEIKGHVCHWFTVDDLHHLKRGGRVNAATALLGTMLSIKPVLHVDEAGCLVSMGKARGRRASLLALVDHMEASAREPEKQTVFLTHGDCREDAEFVAEELRRRLHVRDVRISYVGPVVGSHSGPGTLAMFFLGQPR